MRERREKSWRWWLVKRECNQFRMGTRRIHRKRTWGGREKRNIYIFEIYIYMATTESVSGSSSSLVGSNFLSLSLYLLPITFSILIVLLSTERKKEIERERKDSDEQSPPGNVMTRKEKRRDINNMSPDIFFLSFFLSLSLWERLFHQSRDRVIIPPSELQVFFPEIVWFWKFGEENTSLFTSSFVSSLSFFSFFFLKKENIDGNKIR